MKTVATFALIILVCVLHEDSAASDVDNFLRKCCRDVKKTCIPERMVKRVVKSDCSVKAILVMTLKNRIFCLDSNWTWAKDLLEKFNRPAGETTKMPLNITRNCTEMAATSAAMKHP